MAEPGATIGAAGGEGMPQWPATHRIARVRPGSPSIPVPWILAGVGQTWAWDPTAGLLALTDLGSEKVMLIGWSSLSPDGRLLSYQFRNPSGPRPLGYSRATYHLESGERTTEPLTDDRIFYGTHGLQLIAQYNERNDNAPPSSRYIVLDGGEHRELPVTDELGYNFTGPPAQFSSAGNELAIGHYSPYKRDPWMSIVNLSTGTVARLDGFALASCAAWSPHGNRLLVKRLYQDYPDILDKSTGELRSLEPIIEPIRAPRGQTPTASGWLDDTQLLVTQVLGRRLLVSVVGVDSGEHHALLDLPLPTTQMDFYGLMMASAVAQANPALVGFLGE